MTLTPFISCTKIAASASKCGDKPEKFKQNNLRG
jgi:hypothetical protein